MSIPGRQRFSKSLPLEPHISNRYGGLAKALKAFKRNSSALLE